MGDKVAQQTFQRLETHRVTVCTLLHYFQLNLVRAHIFAKPQ